MIRLSAVKLAGAVFVLCAATTIAVRAQTFTTLVDFDGTNGTLPGYGPLIQARDGSFYGTVMQGGTHDYGTIYRVTSSGEFETVYNFCRKIYCPDGGQPSAGLLLTNDGNAYGTTYQGGAYGFGTIFQFSPRGHLTVVHSFDSSDGANPQAGLIQGADRNFYGTTNFGGTNGYGTIFRITREGAFTTLHKFVGTDGANPFRALVQADDGNFYGVTQGGGSNHQGTAFKITPSGTLTTLYNFCAQTNCTDGAGPNGLVQGSDGNFYGTTSEGGSPQCDIGCGTAFTLTLEGGLTTLYTFCLQTGCADGEFPYAGLVQATDGNFYGTTYTGAISGGGTIFKMTPGGMLTTMYFFCSESGCTDGESPSAALLQATNGSFYGTTYQGGDLSCGSGNDGCGTIFSLDVGLGPFVTFVRAEGRVGQTGGVLGQGFTGTTSVSLNGIAANFTVVSDTFIKATVPAGATTGYVTVATPSGTLTSNVKFYVIP
jgi:uncharacterized repeat protein (TIGR03803 family)